VIPPNVTHAACDLDQQRRLHEARRELLARAVRTRRARRPTLGGLLRRRTARELTAADTFLPAEEDVDHALRGCSLSRW
jgi:hypothetical protein